ncbi:MAG TPA: hypothetical protein VFN67_02725, partial [Polyangiales bacterium]|nr:hypothetical protein [Polyangiales bacterium]
YYMHEKEKARGELDLESQLLPEASDDEVPPPGAADDSAHTSGPTGGAADGATGDGPKLVSTTDSNAEGTPKPQASETEAQP